MTTGQSTVRNEYGIHCRPSAIIAREAQAYAGSVLVSVGGKTEVDASSVLLLVGLGIRAGTTVTISVSGPDEHATCERFLQLFATEFDFPRDS